MKLEIGTRVRNKQLGYTGYVDNCASGPDKLIRVNYPKVNAFGLGCMGWYTREEAEDCLELVEDNK